MAQQTLTSTSALPPTEVRQRADQAPAEPAREHDATEGISLDRIAAALPDAVREAAERTMPGKYTPEWAAQFAATMLTQLRQEQEPRPLTAAQRGPEWMNRWGCPGFCTVEHGTPEALEIHSTAPVETSLLAADLDSSGYSDGSESLPWLSAQVLVSNDKSQAYGRTTSMWLGYGMHLAELSPAKAREALAALRAFIIRLAAVVDFAEQTAADDFLGDPEIARLDREAEDRRIAARTAELLDTDGRG